MLTMLSRSVNRLIYTIFIVKALRRNGKYVNIQEVMDRSNFYVNINHQVQNNHVIVHKSKEAK